MQKIVLGTASPYRREAFEFLGIPFTAESSDIDEKFEGRPSNPEELVSELAKRKAEHIAKNHNDAIIIGFDSIGWHNNQILEKPESREEAFTRLKAFSGSNYQFITGIHIINLTTKKTLSKVVTTNIDMREFSEEEINKYLDQDPRFNTYAVAYNPLTAYSATFIKKIEGSYNNITRGIPLETVVEMLKEIR